jgi:lysophospholipase L1-like esterase
MRTICIFGDSIAFGHNAERGEGWAHHLKKFLEERDTDTAVVNLARDGEMTSGVLSYIDKECEKHKPAEIIIALGLNDSAYSFTQHRPRIQREQFDKNFTEILEIAKKYAQKIVVLGIMRVNEIHSVIDIEDGTLAQYQNITLQKFNDSLKGISESLGAHFIDLYSLLSDEELDDGFHPTTAGHLKIFNEVKKVF